MERMMAKTIISFMYNFCEKAFLGSETLRGLKKLGEREKTNPAGMDAASKICMLIFRYILGTEYNDFRLAMYLQRL